MAISIENFRQNFRGQGYRTNLFEVSGPIGNEGADTQTTFLVRAAQLPASNLGTVEVPFRGRTIKLPGDRSFDDWTITVLMDDFDLRDKFERWSNSINTMASNRSISFPQFTDPDSSGYLRDWSVTALGRNGERLKNYNIIGCFPSVISSVDLSADATTTVGEFTVTLTYQYWTAPDTTDGSPITVEPVADSDAPPPLLARP